MTLALQYYTISKAFRALTMSTSIAAAKLVDGDRKASSALETPITIHYESKCSINADSALGNEQCSTSLFILEVIMMTARRNIEGVDWIFKDPTMSILQFLGRFYFGLKILNNVCRL